MDDQAKIFGFYNRLFEIR